MIWILYGHLFRRLKPKKYIYLGVDCLRKNFEKKQKNLTFEGENIFSKMKDCMKIQPHDVQLVLISFVGSYRYCKA